MSFNMPKYIFIALKVSYSNKDKAKKYKMRWNKECKEWYVRNELEDIDLSDYAETYTKDIIGWFGELFQFDYLNCSFSGDFYDESNFNKKLKDNYKIYQDKWKLEQLNKSLIIKEVKKVEEIDEDEDDF